MFCMIFHIYVVGVSATTGERVERLFECFDEAATLYSQGGCNSLRFIAEVSNQCGGLVAIGRSEQRLLVNR